MVKIFTSHFDKSYFEPSKLPTLIRVVYEREGSRSENRNIQVENKYVGLNNER